MRRVLLLLLLWPSVARADQAAVPPPPTDADVYIQAYHGPDGQPAPTADELEDLTDLRGDLRHQGTTLLGQCEVYATHHRDKAHVWMQKAVQVLYDAREAAIQRIEDLFPASSKAAITADALLLLMHLHEDQELTQGELELLAAPDSEPCDPGEPSDTIRYDRGYYAASAAQQFVTFYPQDRRRADIELELIDLDDQMGAEDQAVQTLEDLLCPGAGDASIERSLDSIDQQLGQRLYGGSTVDYATCTPSPALGGDDEVSAWLRLAEYEKRTPGRRAASIAAMQRAIAVPDTTPTIGTLWELAEEDVDAGLRVDAIPLLDEVAAEAYADSSQIEVGDLAVAKTGEVLALLWRESSLPKPDAALELARIYFNDARRDEPHVRAVYEALSSSLRDMGAYEQAASVERHVVEEWPLHPAAPQAASARIDIEVERGDPEAADAARQELITRFADGGDWAKQNGDAAAVLVDDTRIALARARFHEATAAAAHKQDDAGLLLTVANNSLEDVIDHASPSHAVEARLLLGEMLLDSSQADDAASAAAAQLEAAAKVLPDDSPLRRTALEQEVRGWEAAVAKLTLPKVPSDFTSLVGSAATTMPDAVASLRAAYDEVLPVLERDDDVARTLLRAATLDLRYGRLDDAEAGLRSVVTDHCFSDSTKDARDVLVRLVDARAGEAAGQAIASDVAARGCLDDAKAQAARDAAIAEEQLRARKLADKGDHAGAARLYAEAYLQTPSSSTFADDVLDQTAVEWEKAGELGKAARLWNDLDRRPELASSPLYRDMLQHRAQVLDRQLDWPRAAAAYLALAAAAKTKQGKRAADAPLANESTWRAAELLALDHAWLDRGDEPGAITLFRQVARGGGGHAGEAWLRAGELAKRAGKRDLIASIHAEWKKKHDEIGTQVLLEEDEAVAADAAGDHKAAEGHYKEVVARGWDAKNLGADETDAVAEAKFWILDDQMKADDDFVHFRWGKSKDEDSKRLDAIGQRFGQYSAALSDLAARAPRWEVATEVRSAELMLTWIDAIVSAPPPAWVIAEFSLQKTGGDYAAQMRALLMSEYQQVSEQLKRAIAAPRELGMEHWLRIAEQRLAEIASQLPVTGGLRTEIFVEETEK